MKTPRQHRPQSDIVRIKPWSVIWVQRKNSWGCWLLQKKSDPPCWHWLTVHSAPCTVHVQLDNLSPSVIGTKGANESVGEDGPIRCNWKTLTKERFAVASVSATNRMMFHCATIYSSYSDALDIMSSWRDTSIQSLYLGRSRELPSNRRSTEIIMLVWHDRLTSIPALFTTIRSTILLYDRIFYLRSFFQGGCITKHSYVVSLISLTGEMCMSMME
jgi:hypothetical protein